MIRNINLAIITVLSIGATDSHTPPKCRLLNGYEGECRYLDKCKPMFELNEKLVKTELEVLFLQQSTCGTSSNYRYKVCCPPQSEWWRELQVDPILYPELVNFMKDRTPNSGQNKKKTPGSTNGAGSTSTIYPNAWNTNQGSNFGQAQGAKRPPLYDQTAQNVNSYGFDSFSQKGGQTPFVNPTTWNPNTQGFSDNNAQRVGQTSSNGQNAWSLNNFGTGINQARRTERPPFQGQITNNANTNENKQPSSTVGQNAWNANSQGFGNDQGQRVGQNGGSVGDQTWNANGQNAWNLNNFGTGVNQERRTERPFQGQFNNNANTHENDQSSSSVSQTACTANSQDINIYQGQKVEQNGGTASQSWNVNVDRLEKDQSQGIGQTTSKGPFSEHPYKFDSIPPRKFEQTTTDSQILPLGPDNPQGQTNQQTTPKIQIDLNANTEKIANDKTGQSPPSENTQINDNNQSQIVRDPSDEQIALSVNNDEIENGSSPNSQTAVNNVQTSNTNSFAESEKCGVQAMVINAGIVGGEAAPEQYPWLALLEYSGGVVNCGGSLITRTHVLTAAHCVETMRGSPTAVRLSEYNMTTYPVDMAAGSDGDSRPISITLVPVEWSKKHPQFGHSHYQHDIGLVKMTRPVDYTDFVRPICLPQTDYTKSFDIQTKLLVAGWGTDSSKIEDVKVDSQESYVPIGICNRLVKRALNSKQMCAGERPSRRPCVGDYGGPLMLETDNAYVVVGVLSYGPNQCAGGSMPDVSTNVYEYLDWINENVVDSNEPPTTVQS